MLSITVKNGDRIALTLDSTRKEIMFGAPAFANGHRLIAQVDSRGGANFDYAKKGTIELHFDDRTTITVITANDGGNVVRICGPACVKVTRGKNGSRPPDAIEET